MYLILHAYFICLHFIISTTNKRMSKQQNIFDECLHLKRQQNEITDERLSKIANYHNDVYEA